MLGGRRGSQFCCYIHYQILFESHIWLILLLNIKGGVLFADSNMMVRRVLSGVVGHHVGNLTRVEPGGC